MQLFSLLFGVITLHVSDAVCVYHQEYYNLQQQPLVFVMGSGYNKSIDSYTGFIISRTHDKHQWLLLQFIIILMMDANCVRNM